MNATTTTPETAPITGATGESKNFSVAPTISGDLPCASSFAIASLLTAPERKMRTPKAAWATRIRISGRRKLGFAASDSNVLRGLTNTPTRACAVGAGRGGVDGSVAAAEAGWLYLSPSILFI